MFGYFKYRWTLSKLQKKRRLHLKQLRELLRARPELNVPKDREAEMLHSRAAGKIGTDIDIMVSGRLIEIAENKLIQIPVGDSIWKNIGNDHPEYGVVDRVLTTKGQETLRTAIRGERKYHIEILTMWIAPLTGLPGILTGLIAVYGSFFGKN